MTTVEIDELPKNVRTLALAALDAGWSIWATEASGHKLTTGEPMTTVAVRFANGANRCYGSWRTDRGRVEWNGGAANRLPPGHLRTLSSLKAALGVA